jgi:oligopeptide/dipeptide ABC transporter ATP-binding protein
MNIPLLRVRDLGVSFGEFAAVSGVSFEVHAGETVGLVGESGSGKSTLARAILRLQKAHGGSVELAGVDLLACSHAAMRAQRRNLQIVFQDPLASLNPRMTIGASIAEPLKIFEPGLGARARQLRVDAMLEKVGLSSAMTHRFPHEFSGGQCQRVGIARAMILGPKLLICDEPVSSLDLSIQGQIINLLLDLQREAGMGMLFISHNLAVVRHMSHRVMVMYLGKLVEVAPGDALFSLPAHPYTRALLAAVPSIGPARDFGGEMTVVGTAENGPVNLGCDYRDRCPIALPLCQLSAPPLAEAAPQRFAACYRAHETLIPLS